MDSLTDVVSALEPLELSGRLRWLASAFPGAVRFSTSMGREDQVIADAIWRDDVDIEVFTLDTGRLFEETLALIDATRAHYGKQIAAFFPETGAVEALVRQKGHHSFYDSVANRQECCGLRKVEPLSRALRGAAVWVTGLRAAQSTHREALAIASWDADHGLIKVNPVVHWTDAEVDAYLALHDVPVNPLHGQGFMSIGCAPCTRAIATGEDARAGRWWWEQSAKECGLHR